MQRTLRTALIKDGLIIGKGMVIELSDEEMIRLEDELEPILSEVEEEVEQEEKESTGNNDVEEAVASPIIPKKKYNLKKKGGKK